MTRSPLSILRSLVEQGVTRALDQALAKRIRLTNGMALFATFVMFASIPFDRVTAPRWMLIEDVVGGLVFLSLPLLNRLGLLTLSRLLCLATANAIVLGNAVLLGPESGATMIFLALAALPFALFDLRQRWAIGWGVLLAVAGIALAESDQFAHLRSVSENYSATAYHVYSAAVALATILFILIQTARANDRAERELRDSREASIYSAKMAALGEMSSNLAHEVNNPLTAIHLRAERLIRLAQAGNLDADTASKVARDIDSTVQRIARIVEGLRTFSRDAANDPLMAGSVSRIVGDTVELCAERFRQHAIALEVEPIAADLTVQCRAVQISQILLNLLSNAHDAVEGQPGPWVRIAARPDGEGQVQISVTDSGPGIPPALRPLIMEPFFTTKDVGKGTGLGLSISKGLAEAHHGHLTLDPTAANTRFVLSLKYKLT